MIPFDVALGALMVLLGPPRAKSAPIFGPRTALWCVSGAHVALRAEGGRLAVASIADTTHAVWPVDDPLVAVAMMHAWLTDRAREVRT